MKFTLVLPIARSRAEVWKAFDNPENLKIWQSTLVKIENLSGRPGQPGTVSKLTFSEGKREFFLIERVSFRDEPNRLDYVYENDFADNSINNTFIAASDHETLWKMDVEFKFKTLLMKIIGPLKKKNFVARSEKEMSRFKQMVVDG